MPFSTMLAASSASGAGAKKRRGLSGVSKSAAIGISA
jgi:hypothetical protein